MNNSKKYENLKDLQDQVTFTYLSEKQSRIKQNFGHFLAHLRNRHQRFVITRKATKCSHENICFIKADEIKVVNREQDRLSSE